MNKPIDELREIMKMLLEINNKTIERNNKMIERIDEMIRILKSGYDDGK